MHVVDVLSLQAYALVLDDTFDYTYNHHIVLIMKSWVRMKLQSDGTMSSSAEFSTRQSVDS